MNTKIISTILSLALTLGLCQTAAPAEAATPQLSTKKLTIEVGKTTTHFSYHKVHRRLFHTPLHRYCPLPR